MKNHLVWQRYSLVDDLDLMIPDLGELATENWNITATFVAEQVAAADCTACAENGGNGGTTADSSNQSIFSTNLQH